MKKIVRIIAVLICIITAFASFSVSASEEIPYDTYTYWETGADLKSASITPIYKVKKIISSSALGLEPFKTVSDVFVSKSGITYILDGDASSLYMLDKDYNLINKIVSVSKDGSQLDFTGARGVFVSEDIIYICDTENARVLLCDANGKYIDSYTVPDSPLIPKDFKYRPLKVAKDSYGYVYILSDGSYYGALLFSEEKEFVGFYGANTVKNNVLGAIQSAFNRIFVNNVKKSATATSLPYVFSDLCVDKDNFVYTATGYTDANQKGQIKKLNPGGGSNVLNSDSVNFTDTDVNTSFNLGKSFNQDILSVDVDENGLIYALDSGYGRVFIYDQSCGLVAAFGGGMHSGMQKGTFVTANALSIYGNNVFVSDAGKCTVTVFEPTEYGKLLMNAIELTNSGKYEDALPLWQQLIKLDRNCKYAYSGIALAENKLGNYKEAMQYAKEGYDRETYALAFKEVRNDWIESHFALVAIIAIVVIGAIAAFMVVSTKRKISLIKNPELKLLFAAPIHPVRSFGQIQEKKMGSLKYCFIIIPIYYVVSILRYIAGGFAFTAYDPETFNSIEVLIRSVGLIALWIIVNWAVSTLFGGRGTVKQITVLTCYSLQPLIWGNIAAIILTNVLVPTESAFISILYTVLQLYTLLLIVIGTVVIHDYDAKHFIGTTFLTVLGIAIVVFLMIMIIMLVQQLGTFLITVLTELTL